MAPSWAYGWRRSGRIDGAVCGLDARVGAHLWGRGRARRGGHMHARQGARRGSPRTCCAGRCRKRTPQSPLGGRYPHGSSPRDGPRRGGRMRVATVPARLVVRVARHHEVHSRARALAPPRHFAAALRHERDKARARKGAPPAQRGRCQRTARPQAAQPAGWKPNGQPLMVVFTAVDGGLHSRWSWCSRYASASAHGGCKHRPARASASALGGSKHRPARAYASEHVRGAGQRQHVRQAARGREVEGVTSAGLTSNVVPQDAWRRSPSTHCSTVKATQPYVASHCSATHERWGWARARRRWSVRRPTARPSRGRLPPIGRGMRPATPLLSR